MTPKNYEKIIEVLTEKIASLETEIFSRDIQIETLKKDNAKLDEFLTPTKKDGEKYE